MVVFAAGPVLVVAPVLTAALLDIRPELCGTASGVNNAVARVAGLVAIAVLPDRSAARRGRDRLRRIGLGQGYGRAPVISAAVCALGGAIAAAGFRNASGAPHQS
jgi:hypothetical protein